MTNDKFTQVLVERMNDYGVNLSAETIRELSEYYTLLMRWNDRLHLVAPCDADEFATRHVLESLLLLKFLSTNATIVDVGSGAGLPIIPCLIARPDLSATLIESSQKKSVFLREASNRAGVANRVAIVAKPFEQTQAPEVGFVTCRALDEFISKLSDLLKWSPVGATLLLFGGETLRQKLVEFGTQYTEVLIPNSEKRFLFVINARGSSPTVKEG
jgi:16S rRNA (guanine527-N7)-methyltransferase